MGCESAAKVIADIFGKAHTVGSALGCAVASVVGPAFGVPVSYQQCFTTAEQAANFTGKMIGFWNDSIRHDGWGTIGPRQLTPNRSIDGMVPSRGTRMFIMPYPMQKDNATLTITERDGKGKTHVTVCKYNEGGRHTEIVEWMFNDTDDRKDHRYEARTLHLQDVLDHILVVKFEGQSLTNTFAYTLRLEV